MKKFTGVYIDDLEVPEWIDRFLKSGEKELIVGDLFITFHPLAPTKVAVYRLAFEAPNPVFPE